MTTLANAEQGFSFQDVVELANLDRAGLVESRHFGIAVLTAPDGTVLAQYGDPSKLIYPRSSVKPLQAIAVARAGAVLVGARLAISCGSHAGTPAHTALVAEILGAAGLGAADLQCPVAWPGDSQARAKAVAQTKECFNCSGKHAGFLAACVAAGWATADYLNPNHPLQVLIGQVLEEYSGESITVSTIDGCGAPLHAMSLAGLSRAIGKLASTQENIVQAMLQNPWAVGGYDSPDYFVMQHGMIAKLGAEGVFVIGLTDGHAVAVKVADGSLRPAAAVALKVLLNANLISQSVFEQTCLQLDPKVLGGGEVVGSFRVCI
jgi:L-asparaginase II